MTWREMVVNKAFKSLETDMRQDKGHLYNAVSTPKPWDKLRKKYCFLEFLPVSMCMLPMSSVGALIKVV